MNVELSWLSSSWLSRVHWMTRDSGVEETKDRARDATEWLYMDEFDATLKGAPEWLPVVMQALWVGLVETMNRRNTEKAVEPERV